MLAASHAAPLCVTVSTSHGEYANKTDRQTDARLLQYACARQDQRNNIINMRIMY